MTPTGTEGTLSEIKASLKMNDPKKFATSPNRANIFFGEIPLSGRSKLFEKLCENVINHGVNHPKCIVYVESYSDLVEVQEVMLHRLQGFAYSGYTNSPETCL